MSIINKVKQKIKQGVKGFLTPLRNYNIEQKKIDDENRAKAERMMAGGEEEEFASEQPSKKRRTSTGWLGGK